MYSISIPTPKRILRGWGVSTAKRLNGKHEAKLEIPGGGVGVGGVGGYKPNNHPCRGMDIFWNHTILVYGNAKFYPILTDSKSNCWSLVMWNTFSQATCEDYFNQNMYDEKKKKLNLPVLGSF